MKNMKIVIKEISQNGSNFLVYLKTDTNQSVSCELIKKGELNKTIEQLINNNGELPQERYSYKQYIKEYE